MTPDPTAPTVQRSQAVEDYLQGAREILEELEAPKIKATADLIAACFTQR
jgi:hypothetical protein